MSSYADPYVRNSNYEYRERPTRSPDREYDRSYRERSGSSDAYYGGGGSSSSARYRDRSPRDYHRSPRDERRRGYHRSSRERELSRERDRERDRDRDRERDRDRDWDRERERDRDRDGHRDRERERGRDRERSYSRGRRSPWQNDSDEERPRYSSRDRHHEERRDERRRRSYDDDRSSRGGSYDSGRSKRDSDYDRSSSRSSRGLKDDWLAHVWGDGARPESFSGGGMDHDGAGPYEHFDRSSYKSQTPNKTLIIRGLTPYVTERDIREEIIRAGGNPRDIRLIRKKDTGSSRGFAFVEFGSTEEARSMVERHDGEFRLLDQRVIMQYSIQRDFEKEISADWYCRCSALNFKRREFCYKCGSDRRSGECSDSEETSSHPTHTVMLKGLDSSTTEENVLKAIQTLSSLAIRSVRIGRDKLTNVSRGVCYMEMNNVSDAMYLHNALLTERLRIDGRLVHVSYCKSIPVSTSVSASGASNAGNAAIAAAQWSHQKNNETSSRYTLQDVPRLAEYSASVYAKTSAEREAYTKHYTDYYTKVINDGGVIPSLDGVGSNPSSTGYQDGGSTADSLAAASAVVSAAPSNLPMAPSNELPSGNGEYCYPVPDVSTYQYDKTSGYYYDPKTTLYYDANSQYYFNSKINKFLYWDGHRRTYLLAPSSDQGGNGPNPANASQLGNGGDAKSADDDRKGNRPEDKDKVKVAKRIAKDMEKWAKTLNHKKEIAKQNLIATQAMPVLKTQGAADIGYTVGVLGRKDSNQPLMNAYLGPNAGPVAAANDSLVAEYGQGSDSEEDAEDLHQQHLQDDKHVDWSKMACLLCKRAFPNRETLLKHQQLSDLHKQNLEAFYRSIGISVEDAKQRSVQYRDRAKERRVKYNEPDVPPTNRLKENYMRAREATISYEEPTRMKIGGDNVGNKLLQKMGWQEGMGLGKSNQGRTDIIQAEARPMSAGLGIRTQGVTPGPGETYKDCVKKMMRSRYEEVDNR